MDRQLNSTNLPKRYEQSIYAIFHFIDRFEAMRTAIGQELDVRSRLQQSRYPRAQITEIPNEQSFPRFQQEAAAAQVEDDEVEEEEVLPLDNPGGADGGKMMEVYISKYV